MTRKCRPDARLRALPLIPVLVLGCLGAAAPAVAQDADHLILSEIVTTVNRVGARFIEIVNPTGEAVPLDDVYLTTGTNVTNSAGYWRIVEAMPTSATAGGGTGGFFHGRFPAGAAIAAGDTITISVTGSGLFAAAYGYQPDFEVFEEGATADAVPELVEVFPGSINAGSLAGGTNAVTLGSTAGSVAMYRWDGSSELVADLDYAHWGTNTGFRVDKTGYTFGSSTYLADTAVGSQTPLPGSANDGRSYLRTSASEGTEATPGNGGTGHDETSEVLSATWSVVQPQGPAAPPAAWLPTAPIFGETTVNPAEPYDGQPAVIGLELASNSAVTSVVVNYTVDGGPVQTVNATAAGGLWNATIPGQAEGAVIAWWAVATNAAGVEAVHPAAAPRFTGGWTTDEAPVVGEGPDKLLLTEVCTLGADQEFIEIYNPNAWDVDLSDYYLTDAIYAPGNTGYWNIGGGVLNADTVGGGAFTDFHARFPDGFVIAAGDTIVVVDPRQQRLLRRLRLPARPRAERGRPGAGPGAGHALDLRHRRREQHRLVGFGAEPDQHRRDGHPLLLRAGARTWSPTSTSSSGARRPATASARRASPSAARPTSRTRPSAASSRSSPSWSSATPTRASTPPRARRSPPAATAWAAATS